MGGEVDVLGEVEAVQEREDAMVRRSDMSVRKEGWGFGGR